MSILRKPYEISVWDDVWDSGQNKFVEKKICVIGSDKMESQSRVIEPNFTRNVNGVKKLSFKLYKKYIDNITGQETENIFAKFLANERKVKLKYGTYVDEQGQTRDCWYDFIIKDVNQTSSNYLYSYQLEDALVQELSKNGYDVTLDSELQNDLGTAEELANRVLKETDWTAESEVFVQKVEEALVYLKTTNRFPAHRILDQVSFSAGVAFEQELTFLPVDTTILAFYSSCVDKPHRFQFIYVGDEEITRDEKRVITNKNCQYFLDCDDPTQFYSAEGSFNLPEGLATTTVEETYEDNTTASVSISGRYRGARYGFAHQAKYIPVLDRYVNLYNGPEYDTKDENEKSTLYYGYEDVKYISPAIVQNLVSSADFSSTSGWTATKTDGEEVGDKPVIEAVYGRFENGFFKSCIDDIRTEKFQTESIQEQYKPYLKISFPHNGKGAVINSGPFDKRTTIKNLSKGDKLAMRYVGYIQFPGQEMQTTLDVSVGEYVYDTGKDAYIAKTGSKISFTDFTKDGDYYYSEVGGEGYSEAEFKKDSKIKILIKPTLAGTIYLETFELFQATFNDKKELITPDTQADTLVDGTTERRYFYFKPDVLKTITKADELKPDEVKYSLTYEKYKPIYNAGAEKVRTVSAKESNYFNILQSIAETFEAWLALEIERDADGAINGKKVRFKNYAGGNNYAGFKYGVNLKDIQRTYASKDIVTKLIVKQNNNEYGEDGFCTIARAGANPSGDTNLYDFQYYFSQGLLNESDYNNTLYTEESTEGLNGYFPRLKRLNNEIISVNKNLLNIASDLTKYKAQYEVAKAGLEAAEKSIEDVRERFKNQFKVEMDGFDADVSEIVVALKSDNTSTITSFTGNTYKNPTTKKWSVSGAFMRGTTLSGVKGTATLVLTYPTGEEQDVAVEYNFVDGLNFTGVYAEFTPIKIDLSSAESLFVELSKYYSAEREHGANRQSYEEKVATKQTEYDEAYETINELIEQKSALNKLFFTRYSRFIQEGTWMDENYYDDNLYYADALSVMYNSCYPQVAYNINVLSLSGLPGYEFFEFNPGDKTYAEDPDFFGSDRREEVIITELSESLDDPSKNTIRVQNFKNQFQDLFQRITATVQQTQYSTGAYEKAVALAEASPAERSGFLTGALDSADTMLQAAGQQSVTWGNDGITIRRVETPSDAIRMVGGAILLSKQDENGEQKWVTGMTTEGISASLVTAGTVNTGTINIMNGDEPAFRWNAFGISAFDDSTTSKFVRFDKYGIYGVQGVDGLTWAASNQGEVSEKATYYLTWDGLSVTPQNLLYTNNSLNQGVQPYPFSVKLGRVDDLIFNNWNKNGIPRYDNTDNNSKKFVKVFAVGDKVGETVNEQFVLYSDGTLVANNLKFTGTIEWAEAASPSKDIYGKESYNKPDNGTQFSEFDNSSEVDWHKIYDEEKDTHYCHTDDGGATWNGPFLISAKSVDHREAQYCVADASLSEAELENLAWNEIIPAEVPGDGECVWTRIRDIYTDTTYSEWFYVAGGVKGTDAYSGRVDSSHGQIFLANDTETQTTLTGYIYRGTEEVDPEGKLFKYVWYKKQGETTEIIEGANGKSFTISVQQLVGWSVYFKVRPSEGVDAYILVGMDGKVLQDIDLCVLLSNELKQFVPPIDFVAYKNGTDINIKGVAYTKEIITDNSIGNTYILYEEETCITLIVVEANQEDWCYLVGAYLFVYSGSDNKFICAGKTGEKGDDGVMGPKTEVVYIYKATSDRQVAIPRDYNDELKRDGWSEEYPSPINSNAPYIWRSNGLKITNYNDPHGMEIDSIAYFNNWSIPELYAAYSGNTGINEQNYAAYLRITNFSTEDGLYYGEEGADKGKLCINASFLKSGTILVGDDVNNPVFSADITSKIVKIGGFTVGPLVNNMYQALYYGTRGEPGGVYIVPGGDISGFTTSISDTLRSDWVLMLGDSFGVTREGSLYANAANFGNEITFLNTDSDKALDNNQIGWRNYSADLPNTVTCTLGRVWTAGAYTTDTTEYSTTVTIQGVPEEEITIYVWFNIDGIDQVRSLTIGPTTGSFVRISASGAKAPISLGINNSGISPSNATLIYKRTWIDSALTGGFAIGGNVVPGFSLSSSEGKVTRAAFNYSLGTPELPWVGLVVKQDGIQEVSDVNLKKDIFPISDTYQTFYDTLVPVSYSFKEGKSGRTHIGFGAQHVRDALLKNGLTTADFAGYCSEITPSGEKHYLRYSEFIALNTWQIQKLKPRVQQLEEEILLLKQRIVELESKI